jgi:Skp family chaperone for outer membrane proteins
MKRFRSVVAFLFFAALTTIPAFAQTGAAAQSNMKVALIDTSAFADDKGGIQRYIQAYKSLEGVMKPRITEIQTMETRLKKLQDDYNNQVKAAQTNQSVPINQAALQKLREDGEKLQLEYNYKVEDYKATLARQEDSLIGPVRSDIGKAMQEYAKAKGFAMIFDISKDQAGLVLWADVSAIEATTADFIKFYNARPATASAAAPK